MRKRYVIALSEFVEWAISNNLRAVNIVEMFLRSVYDEEITEWVNRLQDTMNCED